MPSEQRDEKAYVLGTTRSLLGLEMVLLRAQPETRQPQAVNFGLLLFSLLGHSFVQLCEFLRLGG
jgi:hypothetical protein